VWSIDYLEVTGRQVSASKDVSPIAPEKLSISISRLIADRVESLRDLKRSFASQKFSLCVQQIDLFACSENQTRNPLRDLTTTNYEERPFSVLHPCNCVPLRDFPAGTIRIDPADKR
jgi:hypothetical protein